MNGEHYEIAKERFLELMAAGGGCIAGNAALIAISDADVFISTYRSRTPIEGECNQMKMIGCRACYGFGGKLNNRCKVCSGTGKVPA